MKIIYVHGVPMPSVQANTVHVMKMCSALVENGHHLELCIPDDMAGDKDLFEYYGVEKTFQITRLYRPRPGWGRRVYSVLAGLRALLKRPDYVFTRCVLTANVTTFLGLPTILEIHVPPELMGPTTSKAFWAATKRRACKRVVVISEALKQIVFQQVCDRAISDKLFVAHDGAEIKSPPVGSKNLSSDFNVAYAGHLYDGRGVDIIVGAAQKLSHIRFDIFGGTPEYNEKWVAYAKDREVDNIIFHGHVPPADVFNRLSEADVLLAPYQEKVQAAGGLPDTSKWMSPLKIFEYMAAQKPIVCSDLPVLKEVLTDGENSILCPPSDINAWVESIARVESDAELRAALGRRAFNMLERDYTWAIRAKNIVSKF